MIERGWFERHPWGRTLLLAAVILIVLVMLEVRDAKTAESIRQQQLEHDYLQSLHTDYPVGEECYEDGSCNRSISIPR